MGLVPIESYSMFEQNNSIDEAVKARYNIAGSAGNFSNIIGRCQSFGSINDFDPAYRGSITSPSQITSSDQFRNFPYQGVDNVNVRYSFTTDATSKSNTLVCDLCQHQPDETNGSYVCDTEGGTYNGLEGFIRYPVSASDLILYPNGLRLRAVVYTADFEVVLELGNVYRDTVGDLRIDYETGDVFFNDCRLIVYLEKAESGGNPFKTLFHHQIHNGYDATFTQTGAYMRFTIGDNVDAVIVDEDLAITGSPNGASRQGSNTKLTKDNNFFTLALNEINVPASSNTAVYNPIIYVRKYNSDSAGNKGTLIEERSIVATVTSVGNGELASNSNDSGTFMTVAQEDFAGDYGYMEYEITRLGSINT